jgi:hypothetical protein
LSTSSISCPIFGFFDDVFVEPVTKSANVSRASKSRRSYKIDHANTAATECGACDATLLKTLSVARKACCNWMSACADVSDVCICAARPDRRAELMPAKTRHPRAVPQPAAIAAGRFDIIAG